ncbi:MAG: protein kinase [Planctomycetota bacterium]
MSEIGDEYERCFVSGQRDVVEFVAGRDLSMEDLAECLFTDLHLRHVAGEPLEAWRYAQLLPVVATNHDLQVDLHLEAFGYLEEVGPVSESSRNAFLGLIPAIIREQVSSRLASEQPIDELRESDTLPIVARYRIDEEIGRGAFGVVYKAWDKQLERPVALKVLHNQSLQSNDDLFAEARLVAKLEVAGIVSVYDCGIEASGRSFFVTAFLDGVDLRSWLESIDQDAWDRICGLFIRLCDSLSTAHSAGIVHRDIKPSNIIVREGDYPCLLDFGLAIGGLNHGRKGELVGTPAYMSPEQARGEGHLVDARSDLFAVGILLIEALSGTRPWQAKSSRELLKEISTGQPIAIRELNKNVPAALERICNKATAPAMSQRYQSISELGDELRWFAEHGRKLHRASSNDAFKIPSRGLRPFTADDANQYWQLVPGQRNARGVPDAVQWWLNRIEEATHAVLTLYGPSGSGKSSLLHAGVLPFVDSNRTRCITLDASEWKDAQSMCLHLAKLASLQQSEPDLVSLCQALRDQSDRHVSVVIDQFEQVLTWSDKTDREQVRLAMRQANGRQLQFVLVVRDEFWSAISSWMQDLDAPLRDGRNAMGLKRFQRVHAKKVLQVWADAAGKTDANDRFLEQAIDLIENGGRIVPVRLALLATVLGECDWTTSRLRELTDTGSLSGYYLDSVLGDSASRATRRFNEAARAVLRCLTPQSGLIRGPARSWSELQAACIADGQILTESELDDLVDLLDRQLHLITPTENASTTIHYQLPHDFLVPELRRWLNASGVQTAKGRASVDLRLATERWTDDRHNGRLAGPIDCVRFGLVTRPTNERQRDFVKRSARKHLGRGIGSVAVAALLLVGFQYLLLRSGSEAIVQRLITSSVDRLPESIAETRRHYAWTKRPLLERLENAVRNDETDVVDRISLALLNQDASHARHLTRRSLGVTQPMRLFIARQMNTDLDDRDRRAVADDLAAMITDDASSASRRLDAAIVLGQLDPDHSVWAISGSNLCQMLVEANPIDLGRLKDGLFPIREKLVEGLRAIRMQDEQATNRTATFLLAEFAADDSEALVKLLENSSLSELSGIAPAVEKAGKDINAVLRERFKERLAAFEEATASINSTDPNSIPATRLTAIDALRVRLSRQIGCLGTGLLWRSQGRLLLPHLVMSDDPTVRSYLIECYASSRGPADPVVELLLDPNQNGLGVNPQLSSDVASALLQMLGSLPALSQVPDSVRQLANTLYRTTDHLELHASAEWFLKKQERGHEIAEAEFNEAIGYRTIEGQLMVRLPGDLTATVGSSLLDQNRLANEERHSLEIPAEIYFSRHELTIKQLKRFRLSQGFDESVANRKTRDDATGRVNFFDAAAYCNWLSQQEGTPADQWCYLPNEDGEYAPGMQVADDHLRRSGYQIPTPDLWEYACRGGSQTPRPYGYGTELSSSFVRWMGTRQGTHKHGDHRKPNGFGLFDVLGDSAEWSVGLVDRRPMNFRGPEGFGPGTPNPRRPPPRDSGGETRTGPMNERRPGLAFGGGPSLMDAAGKIIRRNNQFVVLGGAFDSPAHKTRSSDRSIISPPYTNKPVTLRLMRIVSR